MSVKDGSRPEKYFEKLPEACNWLADAIYEDRHGRIPKGKDMTVDQRYHFRMDNLICDLAPNTRRNYAERYLINAQPVIGKMKITEENPCTVKRS